MTSLCTISTSLPKLNMHYLNTKEHMQAFRWYWWRSPSSLSSSNMMIHHQLLHLHQHHQALTLMYIGMFQLKLNWNYIEIKLELNWNWIEIEFKLIIHPAVWLLLSIRTRCCVWVCLVSKNCRDYVCVWIDYNVPVVAAVKVAELLINSTSTRITWQSGSKHNLTVLWNSSLHGRPWPPLL